jgi:CubicO group peptidase (beta-lactamase class C family)
VVLFAGNAWANDVPYAQPEDVGFSASGLAHIDDFYSDKVNKGELAGIVTLVARHGKVVHFSAIGDADIEKKKKMETDTIFRLYSMTKPIASTALMMLYEEGRFEMNDPLSKYIPEFANLRVLRAPDSAFDDTVPALHAPTVQDALRHTAGFSHGLQMDSFDAHYAEANVFGLDVSLADMMTKLSKMPLRYQPGSRWAYSVGPDVVARLVEILSGMSFDEFLEKRIFEPLRMTDTSFWVPASKAKRLATVYWLHNGTLTTLDTKHGYPTDSGVRTIVEPWSVNSYTANHKRKGGSFGLLSTAKDYWRYAQMMLNGGELEGTRILSPKVVQYMMRDQLGTIPFILQPGERPGGLGFGLGFGLMRDPAAAGVMYSEGTVFWGGAANTYFWIDPKEDLVVVAMTQHMGVPAADALWSQLPALVYGALLK